MPRFLEEADIRDTNFAVHLGDFIYPASFLETPLLRSDLIRVDFIQVNPRKDAVKFTHEGDDVIWARYSSVPRQKAASYASSQAIPRTFL